MEIKELTEFPRASALELPTLGQLLNFKFDGDTSTDDGDGSDKPPAATSSSQRFVLSFSNLPTLGQLLNFKFDGDTSEDDGDGSETSTSSSQRFVLSFSNLTYSVKIRQKMTFSTLFSRPRKNHLGSPETKTLLDDISGEARDGEILAVMGASGSGKSTLIDALANRIAKGSLKGSVKLNGEAIESRLLKVISAYVMQDDLLFPMLTVEETLTFAAEFRLPRTISKSNKKKRVQALMDQLDLRNAAKTVIGDEGHRGISGGERRRVSIGIDIVHDPVVLFLDEPTSGLDSTSAFMVVKVLQRIARTGSIVIMSIHQPSSRIISLLDRLILLSRGKAVFSGSLSHLSLFFAELGVSIPENENHTDTEFILDHIHELEEGSSSGITNLVEFNKSWQSRNNLEVDQIQNVKSLKEAIRGSMISRGKLVSNKKTPISNLPTFATPFWIEIANLTKRSLTNSRRTPEEFGARFAAVLLTGFILATVFWQLDDSPKGLQERFGFFAFAMSTTFYTSAQALPVFIQERQIFIRETSHNTYRRFSYLVSLLFVSLPPLLLLSLTFATTTFWALGLDGGLNGFLFYFLAVFASFWSAISFVTFLSGVIPNVMVGFTIVVKTLAYFLLFSGFFINRDKIPNYWVWFHYLSLVKYPYEGVLQNEFGDSEKCFVRGVQIFDNTPLKGVPEFVKMKALENLRKTLGTSVNVNFTSETCFAKGEDVLRQNGITELKKWKCLLVTVGWGFWFWTLFYFLLLRSKNKRR